MLYSARNPICRLCSDSAKQSASHPFSLSFFPTTTTQTCLQRYIIQLSPQCPILISSLPSTKKKQASADANGQDTTTTRRSTRSSGGAAVTIADGDSTKTASSSARAPSTKSKSTTRSDSPHPAFQFITDILHFNSKTAASETATVCVSVLVYGASESSRQATKAKKGVKRQSINDE
jgi:hypothetical protein